MDTCRMRHACLIASDLKVTALYGLGPLSKRKTDRKIAAPLCTRKDGSHPMHRATEEDGSPKVRIEA